MDKFKRTNFMSDENVEGILEKDLVNNNWDLFEIKRPLTYFTVTRTFIQRPDLLSLKLYGRMNYWWIVLKVNEEIMDVWNDIQIGSVISVPDIRDIEDFLSAVKLRNK